MTDASQIAGRLQLVGEPTVVGMNEVAGDTGQLLVVQAVSNSAEQHDELQVLVRTS